MRDPIPSDLRPGLVTLSDCATGLGTVTLAAAVGLASWPLVVVACWISGGGILARLLLTSDRTPS